MNNMSDKKDDTDSTPRSNSLQNEETLEKTVPTDHEQGDTAALPRAITGWKVPMHDMMRSSLASR